MTDIERDLTRLSAHLAWPETPDVATGVERSIVAPSHSRRVAALAAVLVAAALALVVLAIPAARERVAAFFGIGAVTIEQGSPPDLLEEGLLGREIDLTLVDVSLPAALGTPDGAYRDTADRLWVVYRQAGDRPGALLTVFETAVEAGLTKLVADTSIQAEQVEVDGTPAYWVAGDDHFILFESPGGALLEDRGRRSAPALIWLTDGITYRLEVDLDRSEAIEIAESMP